MIKLIKYVFDEDGLFAVLLLLGSSTVFLCGLLFVGTFIFIDIHETVNQCHVQESTQ